MEAVERMVNYDDWLQVKVQTGLNQISHGQTISHEEVGTRLDVYLANNQHTA